MKPDNNPELFKEVAEPRTDALNEEFLRRNILAGVLEDLSDTFEKKDHTSHPVTEPTLIARLFALSQVQRTYMGIAGFDPLEKVDFSSRQGGIEAKAAPDHDQFSNGSGNIYNTRIINFSMPDSRMFDSDIDVFGLNFYQPDPDVSADSMTEDHQPSGNGLVLIGNKGSVIDKPHPITGETVLFAVRNRRTNDAKLYEVLYTPVNHANSKPAGLGTSISYESETQATVVLPDNTVATVKQLHGQLQFEAVAELQASLDKLKTLDSPDAILDEKELEIARTITRARGDGDWLAED